MWNVLLFVLQIWNQPSLCWKPSAQAKDHCFTGRGAERCSRRAQVTFHFQTRLSFSVFVTLIFSSDLLLGVRQTLEQLQKEKSTSEKAADDFNKQVNMSKPGFSNMWAVFLLQLEMLMSVSADFWTPLAKPTRWGPKWGPFPKTCPVLDESGGASAAAGSADSGPEGRLPCWRKPPGRWWLMECVMVLVWLVVEGWLFHVCLLWRTLHSWRTDLMNSICDFWT